MYAQAEKSKGNSFLTNRQESRAVANSVGQKKSNGKQSSGFVDNRPEVITKKGLHEKMNTVVQLYAEIQNANANTMWNNRNQMGIGTAALPNNVAWCGSQIGVSALNGHAEGRAIMNEIGNLVHGNINVHTERQPCQECENDLRYLEGRIGGTVTAHYLIPYLGGAADHAALYAQYHAIGKI